MKRVRIESASLIPERFALSRPIANSKARWTEREGVLLRIIAGRLIGHGEAAPLPGFSRDDLEEARRGLEAARTALEGAELPLEGGALDALREVMTRFDQTALSPTARFAIETSLLDLRGHALGRPIWRDLGGTSTAEGPRLSALVAGEDEQAVLASVRDARARGIDDVKLKVGRPGELEREVGAVRSIREVYGAAIRLRLDANGAWTATEAARTLAAFAPFAPDFVEEPVAGAEWLALRASPLPVAIDETLGHSDGDAILDAIFDRRICRGVVVKLSVLGGFVRAMEVAARARKHGVQVIVTHMFEGAVATAASAAFALALPEIASAGLDVRAYHPSLADEHVIGVSRLRRANSVGLGALI